MLNESYQLYESMRKAGIQPPSLNRHYNELPNKQKAFFLELDADGNAVSLREIKDDIRAGLRKWEETSNQGISFPAFNVPSLLQVTEQGQESFNNLKKAIKSGQGKAEFSKAVQALWDSEHSEWKGNNIKKISKSLALSSKLLIRLGDIPEDYLALEELIRRAGKVKTAELPESIRDLIVGNLERASGDSKTWLDFLASTKKFSLVLGLADSLAYRYPTHHTLVRDWINERLLEYEVKDKKESNSKDAFGWPYDVTDSNEKFPLVNLPIIGPMKLRAMFKEQQCQFRYGMAEAYSFRASKKLRQALKDSLEWLKKDEFEGKTWRSIAGACGFKTTNGKKTPIPALLLAYPNTFPPKLPELATFMGGGDDNSEHFVNCAAQVTEALKLVVNEYPETMINILVIKKADESRRKLMVNMNCSAQSLIEAAEEWLQGCANLPEIRLKVGTMWLTSKLLFTVRDTEVLKSPSPTGVTRLLNRAWHLLDFSPNDKKKPSKHPEYQEIYGFGIGEGISLLIDRGWQGQKLAEKALRLAIMDITPLLLSLGHVDHRREKDTKISREAVHDGCLIPSLLGLLLYKLNINKGDYMRSAPFLVGNMLALADLLHREYCIHERKGSIPPQLLGNALMPVALDNPEKGIARLSDRILIYKAWAEKINGEEFRLAKWALGQMKRVSDELALSSLPKYATDSDKAQMLLGYLGRISQDSPEDNNIENQK